MPNLCKTPDKQGNSKLDVRSLHKNKTVMCTNRHADFTSRNNNMLKTDRSVSNNRANLTSVLKS